MLQIFLQPSIALKNKHRGRHVVALKLLFRGESAWYQSVGGRQRKRMGGVWSTQDKEDAHRIDCLPDFIKVRDVQQGLHVT